MLINNILVKFGKDFYKFKGKNMEIEKRLKKIQKIGYGLGDIGSNFSWTFISSFIMLYYTNIK